MFLVPVSRTPSELNRGFDRLFDDAFDRFFGQANSNEGGVASRSPALDVTESERAFTVHLDLPGVQKDQVKVSIDGRRIGVEADVTRQDEKKDGERVVYRERSSSSFARTFTLPVEIDQAESSAKLENGVLTLMLAKRRASSAAQLSVS
jgi:HSP20 family protein